MDATNKPDLMKRFLAALIDGVAILVIYQIPAFGPWLALAYLLLRDGLDFEFVRHRSLGKHFMQLKPVTIEGGELDLMLSARRNWNLAVGLIVQLLRLAPFLAWLLSLAAIAIWAYEAYLVITDASGQRWGDKMAGTQVIEVSE
ncbi:MAG: RDD family protein [Deferribacteres bacterium]|nr:RDD family protein [candidate division KSB1 bacterium]MCB9503905.1 RDD family protein [Deferribacteres bacterium]